MDKPVMIQPFIFTKLHDLCQEYIDIIAKKNAYFDEDLKQYIFEAAIETFFGKNVWDFVNNRNDEELKMESDVWVIFYQLRSNPVDDNGVEGVCASEEIARKEVEKLSARFLGYSFYFMDYEMIRE